MDRVELVERHTEETVTSDELDTLVETIEDGGDVRAYIGFEPSGPVHLGTWLSVYKLLDVEQAGFTPVVLLADLHAAKNNKGDLEWLQSMAKYWKTVFQALGLTDAEYVLGSEFQREQAYRDDLQKLKDVVTVNRATRALGDVASDAGAATVAQIEYPLMQALDIEHLDVDLAMGGTDQRKIHMLARDELPRIGYDSPTVSHLELLPALTGAGDKMSTSEPETMFALHAQPETIRERVTGAFFDPELGVDENPVLEIAARFIFQRDETLHIDTEYVNREYTSIEQLQIEVQNWADDTYSGEATIHPQDVKTGVAEWLVTALQPVREAFAADPELLNPLPDA